MCQEWWSPVVEGCTCEEFQHGTCFPRQLPIRATVAEEAGHPYISPRVAVKLVDDASQEAARAELEQSVVDDDGKAGAPKAAS